MNTACIIKKSLIFGLTASLFSMSLFAQSIDDDEVELLDGEPEIMLISEEETPAPVEAETDTATGTILAKAKKSGATVYLTIKGKKQFTLKVADGAVITMDDLVALNGKVVTITGTAEKKIFTVTDVYNVTEIVPAEDAK